MKFKWELMGKEKNEENKGKKRDLSDIAFEVLRNETYTDEEIKEWEEYEDEQERLRYAEMRMIYDPEKNKLDLSRRRATDLKGNSRVIFPRKVSNFEIEAKLETFRTEARSEFLKYMKKFCGKNGKQLSNLTKSQERGLKSLRERVKNGEIVVLPTDKTGKLAVMTRSTYEKAGQKHVKNDVVVGMEELWEAQKQINGHVAMSIKMFKIGKGWGHTDRVRETMLGEGVAVCPVSLLFKDHKGWVNGSKSIPPTRHVAGGHMGMNLHLSEVVSDVLEPLVGTIEGGTEVISGEDMLARVDRLNDDNRGWSKTSWWEGQGGDRYVACGTCIGGGNVSELSHQVSNTRGQVDHIMEDMGNLRIVEQCHELGDQANHSMGGCSEDGQMESARGQVDHIMKDMGNLRIVGQCDEGWSENENMGIKDPGNDDLCMGGRLDPPSPGKIRTTSTYVKLNRRKLWENEVGWNPDDMERIYSSKDMLVEDCQDYESPMVLIGSDVVSLYPNLDVARASALMYEAVKVSPMEWENMDWLECSRYVALNWSQAQCRSSKLRRVLPWRRGTRGTKPGIKGAGPRGKARGDTEQWIFPQVKLEEWEKRELVAVVVEILTEALFSKHYYTFGGKFFHQRGGGPIGLRGTCAIARVVMQMFDRKWRGVLAEQRITTELLVRYMDDARAFLPAFHPGWRYSPRGLEFCQKWAAEDKHLSPTERTKRVLAGTMEGVETFLEFTFETSEDEGFNGWLPTLDTQIMVGEDNQINYKYFEIPIQDSYE